MPNPVEIVKLAAIEAVAAGKPADVLIGRVAGVSPLRVQVDQKLILPASMLLLARSVTDHTVRLSPEGGAEQEFTQHGALRTGERVLLLRRQGGRQYVVLDRLAEG